MARVPIAPNDPVFYLNHCNVDRLWAEWQRDNKKAVQYPEFGPVPGRRLEDEMIPWITGSTVGAVRAKDVLRRSPFPTAIQSILGEGYKYDTEA
jgi:tyrosinase